MKGDTPVKIRSEKDSYLEKSRTEVFVTQRTGSDGIHTAVRTAVRHKHWCGTARKRRSAYSTHHRWAVNWQRKGGSGRGK